MACGESADKRSGKGDPTRGVGVRACVQCGLSISETATFCQVCGVRYDVDPAGATLEATQVAEGPPADADGPAGGADRWSDAQPYEPGAELVADLAVGSEPAAQGTAGTSDLDADVSAGPEPAEAAPASGEVEPELDEAVPEPAEPAPEPSARDRKLAAVAVLLEAASGCEHREMSRAAALYQEAILGCLDAADGDGDFAGVQHELLRGFDGLSALLERRGLTEEALEVVDDAAALSLLDGGERVAGGHCDALLARREDLRRLLYADSANL